MSYRRQSFLITLTFLASFYCRPILTAQTTFSPKDIQALSKTVREFQNTWYVKQDPKKFRKFFMADSPHFTGQENSTSVSKSDLIFPRLFAIAFIDPSPNPSQLLLNAPQSTTNQDLCLNKDFCDYLCIVAPTSKPFAFSIKKPFLFASYMVGGPGFSQAAVLSVWIKQGRKWKLHTVIPFAG